MTGRARPDSGECPYEPYFLSADVDDRGMSWDDTQVDW